MTRPLGMLMLLTVTAPALAQDYEREQRWADQILPDLMIGDAVWLQETNGHKFLALYTVAQNPRGRDRGARARVESR
jgi:hypothetical protein